MDVQHNIRTRRAVAVGKCLPTFHVHQPIVALVLVIAAYRS